MTDLTLKLFNKALKTDNNVPFETLNKESIKLGYLIHPSVCNVEVQRWLNSKKRDYNSTFYKKWNDVLSKTRFELFVDQLRHYASTYGTNFSGEVYLPSGEIELPSFENFNVISEITREEVIERCEKMLFSGIALKEETIQDIISIFNFLEHKINVSLVKNKEAKMFLYSELNELPSEPTEMVRFLVYLITKSTLLIKDAKTIFALRSSNIEIEEYVERFGYEALSSVFFRFKPLFLALRTTSRNRVCINRLRRLANHNHKPLVNGYFEQILSNKTLLPELEKRLVNISNFKKINLLQTISVRLKNLSNRVFVIRNQKLFIKTSNDKKTSLNNDYKYLKLVYDIIYDDLVNSLKKKATSINLPNGINISLPTSEKSFIGNYPLGTSFDFSDSDNIVGINWRSEDGADDLDLSLISVDGKKYGWNSMYTNSNNSIIYSGDMTYANPEATELFYAKKNFTPSIVKVNGFRSNENAKFKFFIAKEKISNLKHNYMVNPSNIVINVDCQMDSKEKALGVITDNKFILANFRTGKGRVSYSDVTSLYTEYALSTLDCYLSLEKLLKDAGFNITNDKAEIDLRELSKDTLINLIS